MGESILRKITGIVISLFYLAPTQNAIFLIESVYRQNNRFKGEKKEETLNANLFLKI